MVTPTETLEMDIAAENGIITAIGNPLRERGKKELDVRGLYVLPGIIDTHVHFRDPGFTHLEDFETGTGAAACGGITTVMDMPNTDPFVRDKDSFHRKTKALAGRAYVDYCLWGTAVPDNLDELGGLVEAGAISIKAFTGESVRTPTLEDGLLLDAFRRIAPLGVPFGLHAENGSINQFYSQRLKEQGRSDAMAHIEGRPCISEAEAINRAIFFANQTGAHLHICHLSTGLGTELVKRAKSLGTHVTAETCPQYLFLTDEDMRREGSWLKVNPPIRYKDDVERLWLALREGIIDAICTDHAPRLAEEKRNDDIWEATSGLHGVETSVPMMLTGVNDERLSLNEYVHIAAERAAKTFGIYPQKGSIRIGADADLTIVDMNKEHTIRGKELHTKIKITPFEGRHVRGWPMYTIVRGHIVMENGNLARIPQGKLVRRPFASS